MPPTILPEPLEENGNHKNQRARRRDSDPYNMAFYPPQETPRRRPATKRERRQEAEERTAAQREEALASADAAALAEAVAFAERIAENLKAHCPHQLSTAAAQLSQAATLAHRADLTRQLRELRAEMQIKTKKAKARDKRQQELDTKRLLLQTRADANLVKNFDRIEAKKREQRLRAGKAGADQIYHSRRQRLLPAPAGVDRDGCQRLLGPPDEKPSNWPLDDEDYMHLLALGLCVIF